MAGKLPPTPVGVPPGSSFWNDWYEKLRTIVNSTVVNFSDLNFTGSNLTSIATRNHNDLQNIQGGGSGDYYHLTNANATALTAGFTGTGLLVRQTSPTLVTPVVGVATGTSLDVTGQMRSTKLGGQLNAAFLAESDTPFYTWRETDQGADNKIWDVGPIASVLSFRVINDAASASNTWLAITRSGTTISSVVFPTGTISHGGTNLLNTTVALTNGAGASAGTLGNAPVAGNPTKWVPINDNGTTRYIPCW